MKRILFLIILFLGIATVTHEAMAAITIRPTLNLGLTGYWSMDEGSGTQINDQSGNHYNATVTNLNPATNWLDGQLGKSIYLNGTNAYATLPNLHVFGSEVTNGTFSAWVKLSTTAGCNDAGSKQHSLFDAHVGSDTSLHLLYNGGGAAQWEAFITGTDYNDNSVSSSCSVAGDIQNWHYLTLTWTTTGAIALYKDGQLVGQDSTPSLSFTGTPIYNIGTNWNSERLRGQVDEVRTYNRALSASEIQRLYLLTKPKIMAPNNLGLVGSWSFEEGTGTKAGDSSGNGNDGTISSTVTITLTTPGSGSWTAPEGVTSVQVEAWGGGGSGGDGVGYDSGGGGGGGAYAKKNALTVIPGNNYAYDVGHVGENSYFIDLSTVKAAGGGVGGCCGGGGGASSSSVGDTTTSGSDGQSGGYDSYGGNGGNGATPGGGIGGTGGPTYCGSGGDGSAGSSPSGGGGGGGSGCEGADSSVGGTGASGQIVVSYSGSVNWSIGKRGGVLDFDGISNYIDVGNVGSGIKTISFWLKADDTTSRKIMDFDGTDQIELNGSSQIAATSFPGTTIIYIDGVVASTIDSNWHFVTITDTMGVNGSALDIGRVASGYFDGFIDEVRIYNRALAPSEVEGLYNSSGKRAEINSSQNSRLTSGLIGLWSFNGPDVNMTTNTAYDRAGSNNGTISGATQAIGKVGQALSFDGNDDYVSVGTFSVTGTKTLSFWMKTNNASQDQYVFDFNTGTANDFLCIELFPDIGNRLLVSADNTSAGSRQSSVLQSNIWYYVTITKTTNTVSAIYINGVNTAISGSDWNSGVSGVNNVGAFNDGSNPFNGSIDEVRVYNRVLSVGEVQQLYNMGR